MFPLKTLILLTVLLFSMDLPAQRHVSTDTMGMNPTTVTKAVLIGSDSLCSTFLISIPGEVKRHYHAMHTENVVILEGTGVMFLGDREILVSKGDIVVIPRGTKHSVRSTGQVPLKVLSVQSPFFDGKDRIYTED